MPARRVALVPAPVPIWETAAFDVSDAAGLKALFTGTATPEQQKRAVLWIVEQAARSHKMTFQPEGDRASAFAEGRRFVGLQIMRLITTPMAQLKAEAERLAKQRSNDG